MNEESLFAAVLEKKTAGERQALLDQASAGNPALRAAVEGLLQAQSAAGSFLEHPPVPLDATVVSEQSSRDTVNIATGQHSLAFLEPCDKPDRIGRLGVYEVMEVVGQGGMGIVLRAFDTKLCRVVALKVMSPALASNASAVKRFLREATTAAQIHHDHVVTIHAVDDSHQPPYLVMQFIEGLTLEQKIDRQGALDLKTILRIGSQAAAGLAAAHKMGLVHRDVKPANILLENGVERVKITDFGLARAADDLQITQHGLIAGTPQYMSPEQAKGEPIDARSDLFSLGSVLYTMCTGRPAFRADNPVAALRRVCDDTPRPIRQVNAEIPPWLESIVNKLLSKDAAQRFQSASEVAEVLGQCLAHVQNPAVANLPAVPSGGWPLSHAELLAKRFSFQSWRFWLSGVGLGLLAALPLGGLALTMYLGRPAGSTSVLPFVLFMILLSVFNFAFGLGVVAWMFWRIREQASKLAAGQTPRFTYFWGLVVVFIMLLSSAFRWYYLPTLLRPRPWRAVPYSSNLPPTAYAPRARPVSVAAPLPLLSEDAINAARRLQGWCAAWSPDGKRVAKSFDLSDRPRLEVVDVETGETTTISEFGLFPAWSPLSKGPIAFVRQTRPEAKSQEGRLSSEEVWLVESDGTNVRKVADGGSPTWTQDGRLFYRSYEGLEEKKLNVIKPGDADFQKASYPTKAMYPYISPNGELTIERAAGGELVVCDPITRRVVTKAAVDTRAWDGIVATWSPDGRYVCFGSWLKYSFPGLWIMDAKTGRCRLLANGKWTGPAFSPDGKQIAFNNEQAEMVIAPLGHLKLENGLPEAWQPPEHPDPQQIFKEAEADASGGRYEIALAKLVWFYEHAVEYDSVQSGSRHTSALKSWKKLGDDYPPALAALKSFREEAAANVKAGYKVNESFFDLAYLNRALGEEGLTKDLFLWLHEHQPKQAPRAFIVAQPALIRAKEYRLCGLYLDPERSLELMLSSFRMEKRSAQKFPYGDMMVQSAEKRFTHSAATLIALLVVNDRKSEAEQIAAEARKELDNSAFRAAIRTALQGNVPEPWPN